MQGGDMHSRLLARYPMLQACSYLNEVLACPVLKLDAGTVVFDEEQACGGFPLLLAGRMRVIKSSSGGRELQLYRVNPGESCIITSSCLLGHTRYTARGVVEETVEMIVLPAALFHELLNTCEPFRDYVFELFTERLTDLMALVTSVAFQKLDLRLARLLIEKGTPVRATHQAIADELGCAREMVSRLLKGFSEQGWVSLGREQVLISDANALKKFAEF